MIKLDQPSNTEGTGETAGRPNAKAQYSKPVLEVYGPVAELTRGGGGSQVDGPMTTKMSDVRAKEDVVLIGTHALGFGVYAYRYRPEFQARWGHGIQFGVLAQEIEGVLPAAVTFDEDGFRRVDYEVLARVSH